MATHPASHPHVLARGVAALALLGAILLTAPPARAVPGPGDEGPDPAPTTPTEECAENPVPGGLLCGDEIVVRAPDPTPQSSGPDATTAPSAGLSPGAGSDSNKVLDLRIESIERGLRQWEEARCDVAALTLALSKAIDALAKAQADLAAVMLDPDSPEAEKEFQALTVRQRSEAVNRAAKALYDAQHDCG